MATDPATLYSQANCYACYVEPGQASLLELALLRQVVLAKNAGADVTPGALLNQASCYACYGTPMQLELMKLALLAQIVALGC